MEETSGNMRPCGCHHGRPCTCEMNKRRLDAEYACGECINCQLNAKALQKKRKLVRKCVKYDELMAERNFDRLEIAPGCVLRMRKPDWKWVYNYSLCNNVVGEKSAFYTRMRQLRLGLLALRLESAATIERQKSLRKKYNRDMIRAQEALQRVEERRHTITRKMTADVTHVDSDVFDSHSKQLIPAETLLPDLRLLLQAANSTIATEERNLELVEAYVSGIAATKLQQFVAGYLRAQRWRHVWNVFQEDVKCAAAVVIQSVYRMRKSRKVLFFLKELQLQRYKQLALERLCRFFRRIRIARRLLAERLHAEAILKAQAKKAKAAERLVAVVAKIFYRLALWKWREKSREATAHGERKTLTAVLTIQRNWRGLRERLNYQRIRYRRLLSDPVRVLYDKFVVHGDLWRLLFDVDAAFKRYEHREQLEKEDAATFVATLVQDKRSYEDNMMQAWLTASALESPMIQGAASVQSAFTLDSVTAGPSMEGFSLAQSVLQSPMSKDLVSLSPTKSKSEVFPDDLPSHVIRQATYEGFSIAETVAVMRGLVAQGRDASDTKTVLKVLKSRAPLMRNAWKPERIARQELQLRASPEAVAKPINVRNHAPPVQRKATKPHRQRPSPAAVEMPSPVTNVSTNMIDNIPGGLKGSIDRLVFVAGLKCFDPDARQCGGVRGAFVFRIEASADVWKSYLDMHSPLMKIRREQLVLDAIKPHLQTFKENRCFTPFDILRNVRGIDEMVSWAVPRPLVMSIYDVIELLHRQTVHRSDRHIKRQMRVSAQFEAYVERQKASHTMAVHKEIEKDEVTTAGSHRAAMDNVAAAIERDVLELPIANSSMPAHEVLFKTWFLLCSGQSENDELHAITNQRSVARENYQTFLAQVVRLQLAGQVDQVKELVQQRMAIAMRLATHDCAQLQPLGILDASDLVRQRPKIKSYLHAAQLATLDTLLASLSPEHGQNAACSVAKMAPKSQRRRKMESITTVSGKPSAQLSPLIRPSKVDALDESLRSIRIPF